MTADPYPDLSDCTDLMEVLVAYTAARDEVEAWRHFYGDPATGAINRQIGGIKSKLKDTLDELAEARAEILRLHTEAAPPCEHPDADSVVCGCPPCARCGHQPHHHPYLPDTAQHSSCTLIGCTCQVYMPAPTLGPKIDRMTKRLLEENICPVCGKVWPSWGDTFPTAQGCPRCEDEDWHDR